MATTKVQPFTTEELTVIGRAAIRTFAHIAGDTLQLVQECKGRSYFTQDEVIEMVLDADRLVSIGGVAHKLNDRLYALSFKERDKLFKKIFTAKRYS